MIRRLRTSARRACLFPAALALGIGCDASAPRLDLAETTLPDIVIVTIDTLRADHVRAYGYERHTTPHLDALARGGARFETAYSVSSTTLPSHATLFSARYPTEHGAVKNGVPVSTEVPLLAERLRDAGYQTAAFVSSFVVERRFGLARGFDHYDDDFRGADHSALRKHYEGHALDAPFDRRAADTTERAMTWLDSRESEAPFFIWVHYFDPHSPYDPPAPHRERFARLEDMGTAQHVVDLYDGDVHYADAHLGRLVEALEPHAPLTIVTADHGEGLWDHGYLEHGVFLYEEMVRVPWIVHWPGRVAAGSVVGGLAGHVDLAPTLGGLIGLELLSGTSGHDLSPQLLQGAEPDAEHTVYLQRRHYEPAMKEHVRVAGRNDAVRVGAWKLILSPDEIGVELFDLAADPDERQNLAGTEPERLEDLQRRLRDWRSSLETPTPAAPAPPDEEARERLRALGYTD